ncbi:MAG: hypothetical protein KBD29_04320, partial [Candidatus Magasanikbacteria bacterium]|nr:hypothetical protein [Candidatus Magasanikbacteria bacterium]
MLPNVLAQIPINRKRIFQVSMVVGIIVATGTTVFLLQQNQDTRSRASYFVRCGEVSDPSSTANLSAFTIAETLDKSTDTVVQTAERRSSVSPDNFKESLQTRKQALIQSMQSNPKVALANVLDTRERVDIQVVSENCVEEPVEVSGIMDSFVIDYENETSETVYTLETSDNKKLNVHLTEDSDVPSNTQVTLKGFQIDNEVLVDSLDISNFQISEFGENGLISTQAVGHASGDQKVGVILVKFQSATTPPLTQSDLNTVIFTNTNNYYKEVSYDKVSLSGNTFGWFTIPDESGGCSLDTVNRIRNKAFDAATSSMTFRDYERFVIFAYNVTPLGCAFDGLGSVGKGSIETPQGRVNGSWSLVTVKTNTGNMAMQTMIAGHEMGHNFGAGHAKIMNCGTSPLSGGCSVGSEYGDSFSIMGNDIAHMSAPHKEYIGWLPAQNIRTVTSSGSYTIAPIAASSNAVQAIKIPRGNGDFLYIENRERLGFDSNLGRNKPTNVYDGALLHVLQAPHETGLIDFSPPITNPENTPVLPVGSSITDSVSGATVSVTGKTSGTLAVNVTFGGDVVPTFAPTMTTAPTTTQVLTATPTTTVMPTMPTNT